MSRATPSFTDGFLVRLKPLMITERRCQTSVKQAMRAKSSEIIRAVAAKSNYSKLQESMLGGDLETEIRNAVKAIYPCKNVVIRKSQLLQTGVITEKGPTLDEIHAEQTRQEAELKAKKAAADEEIKKAEESVKAFRDRQNKLDPQAAPRFDPMSVAEYQFLKNKQLQAEKIQEEKRQKAEEREFLAGLNERLIGKLDNLLGFGNNDFGGVQ